MAAPTQPTADGIVSTLAPTRLAPDRFARVEALVREASEACDPTTRQRARDFTRYGSYLASWCDSQYLPLRIEVVFSPDIVEEFISVFGGAVPPRSAATVASVLRAMSATLCPLSVAGSPTRHPRRRAKAPYSSDDLGELFSLISRSRSRKRRHDMAALLVLCVATGATGQEAALVGGRDISARSTELIVTLRRRREKGGWREREVVALEGWRDRLEELVVGPDDYMIGGGRRRHSRVYDLCVCTREGRWPVELEPSRARNTYLVEVASAPNTVPELLSRGGVTTLEVYNDLLAYIGPK
ncbi:MAG: hypothetical protein ACYCSF_09865 [Acidimicrobiales bacterium]